MWMGIVAIYIIYKIKVIINIFLRLNSTINMHEKCINIFKKIYLQQINFFK